MTTESICRFRLPHSGCEILGAITASTYNVMDVLCKETCRGAQSTQNIDNYMSQRFRRRFTICQSISEGEIVRCNRAGGMTAKLKNGYWLRSDEPPAPRVKPPLTVMLKSLAQAARDVIAKLVVDTADNGLWAGLQGVVACKEQRGMRWLCCRSCPGDHLEMIDDTRGRCLSFPGDEGGCGCWLPAKCGGAAFRCNQGYWDEVDRQFTRQPQTQES